MDLSLDSTTAIFGVNWLAQLEDFWNWAGILPEIPQKWVKDFYETFLWYKCRVQITKCRRFAVNLISWVFSEN